MKIKKILWSIILGVYLATDILGHLWYIDWNVAEAATSWKSTNPIVAILIDNDTYNSIGSNWNFKRYTDSYIPEKYPGSESIIFSLDLKEYTAPEIVKLLENVYFDGIKNTSSRLIWVIVMGKVPLPVVKYQNYIFPSIYPYTDFIEQKYIWDETQWYFIQNKTVWEAEIWHWLISLNDASKYDKFYNVLDDDAIDEIKEIVQNELGCDGLKDVPVWDYEDSGFDNDYGVILFDPNKSLKKVIDAKFEECEEMTDDLKYFLEETEKKEYHIETYNDNGKKIDDLEIKIPKGIMLPYIMYINDNYNYNDNIRIDWIIDAIESLGYISVTLGNVIANIDDNLEMFYNFVEGYDYDIGSFLETVKKYNEYVIDTLLDYFVKKYKLPDPHDNKYDEFSIIEMI